MTPLSACAGSVSAVAQDYIGGPAEVTTVTRPCPEVLVVPLEPPLLHIPSLSCGDAWAPVDLVTAVLRSDPVLVKVFCLASAHLLPVTPK